MKIAVTPLVLTPSVPFRVPHDLALAILDHRLGPVEHSQLRVTHLHLGDSKDTVLNVMLRGPNFLTPYNLSNNIKNNRRKVKTVSLKSLSTSNSSFACKPLGLAPVATWARRSGRTAPFRGNRLSNTSYLTHAFFKW